MQTTKLALLVLVAFSCCALLAQTKEDDACQAKYLKKNTRFREYVIQIFRAEDEGCLRIRKSGSLVFQDTDAMVYKLGGNINAEAAAQVKPPIGTDITGRGKPNVVVSSWTGGAHCCFDYQVFELGQEFHAIPKIHAEDGDLSRFEDVDHDGRLEFRGRDWTFAYWKTSFANSPAPEILLRYSGNRYRLAPDLMQKPAPSERQIAEKAQELREDDAWIDTPVVQDFIAAPPELWGQMLDWIYQGHADAAWRLLDLTWPNQRTDKEQFVTDFCLRLKSSGYWRELSPYVGELPKACETAKPHAVK